jgi:acyl-CoA-dependent ceramide synthase
VYELSTKDTVTPSLRISDWTYPSKFVYLSYLDPTTGLYLKGPDDVFVVVFWVLVWILLRAVLMRWLWSPLARWSGIRRESQVGRFAEQGWSVAYYTVFWSLGFVSYMLPPHVAACIRSFLLTVRMKYIMQNSSYRNLRTQYFFIGYPHTQLKPITKWYYLSQTSFWLSQIVTINIEKKRKDYVQMFAHHIITSLLIIFSLILNWTAIGNAILCLMDFCDIFLSVRLRRSLPLLCCIDNSLTVSYNLSRQPKNTQLAKMLRYVGLYTLCDATFGFFVISWIVTRHILYNYIIYSIVHANDHMSYCWDPAAGCFWTKEWQFNFVALLLALQVIICVWFVMILRVVYRVLTGQTATDTRSDTEEDEDKEEYVTAYFLLAHPNILKQQLVTGRWTARR